MIPKLIKKKKKNKKKTARHSVEYILWANRANCMS